MEYEPAPYRLVTSVAGKIHKSHVARTRSVISPFQAVENVDLGCLLVGQEPHVDALVEPSLLLAEQFADDVVGTLGGRVAIAARLVAVVADPHCQNQQAD